MAESSVARLLLESARQDENAVAALTSASEIGDAIVGFHVQQAVEKALKAVLSSNAIVFAARKTLLNYSISLPIQACPHRQKRKRSTNSTLTR